MDPIRVLIADDHMVVRKGIQMIMRTEPAIQLVGEASDGESAVRQVKQLQPDVVLMDLVMPRKGGIEATAEIKRDYPQIKIIVLTAFEQNDQINAAMEAGADGYLLKDADGEALLQAIKATHCGSMMAFDTRVVHHLFNEAPKPFAHIDGCKLTHREKEVLQLVATGLSNRAVAQSLNLTEGTVKVHVSNILSKLNVTSRTEAAILAVQMGLVAAHGDSIPFGPQVA